MVDEISKKVKSVVRRNSEIAISEILSQFPEGNCKVAHVVSQMNTNGAIVAYSGQYYALGPSAKERAKRIRQKKRNPISYHI